MATQIENYNEVTDTVIEKIREIVGEEYTLTAATERANRSAVPAPFPVHKWEDYMPEVAVLPETTEEVAEIVTLANEHKIPVVPRGGGTGLSDGARPEHHGIVVDTKRMEKITEVDEVNNTVTVQPGKNLKELNEELREYGLFHPDNPSSYRVATVGGRTGTSGLSLINGAYGHTRDLVISQEVVLPTGEVVRVGDGPAKKVRKSSTGFDVDHMFIGHEGTLGLTTELTLELHPRPEAEFSAFFGFESFDEAYEATGDLGDADLRSLGSVVMFDEQKVQFLRRDDEAYIPQPDSINAVVEATAYGNEAEVSGARDEIMEILGENATYLGEELSEGDWASRHDRYSLPLHGRTSGGDVAPYTWHMEDGAMPRSSLKEIRHRFHDAVKEFRQDHPDLVDDWGCFMYCSNPYKSWGDYLVEIDVGLREDELNEEKWQDWVDLQEKLGEIILDLDGSLTSCHGATRDGVDHLIREEFKDGKFEIMKKIKRTLDPNNIMNPGKYQLDSAYE